MTLRVFLHVLTMAIRKQLSYRANFWANALLGFVLQLGAAYYVWEAMFRESGKSEIGGFSFPEMVTYYVLVILLGRIVRGQDFGAADLSGDIYQGGLTRYLVYPIQVFPFKYAEQIGQLVSPVLQLILFGGLCLTILPMGEHLAATPATVLMTIAAVLTANLLHFLMHWPLESVAFWQDNVWSLNVMARFVLALLGGSMLPLEIFPEWARDILAYMPFQYLFSFPVRVLMGKVSPAEWLQGILICLVWCAVVSVLASLVWRRGLKRYSGVGI